MSSFRKAMCSKNPFQRADPIVHFGMNLNFKGLDPWLKFVHFQKGKVFWNELTEFYQIRVVPDRI